MTGREPDALCLAEHWLSDLEYRSLRVSNFLPASAFCRTNCKGGGAAILINKNILFKEWHNVKDLSIQGQIELCCAYIEKYKLYLLTVYRPPSGSFNVFIEVLEGALQSLNPTKKILILGDFNIHFNTDSPHCTELCNLMHSFGFHQNNFEATRQKNCLDNVFSNLDPQDLQLQVVDPGISDHRGIYLEFTLMGGEQFSDPQKVFFRPITERGRCLFFSMIEDISWDFIKDTNMNANNKFSYFVRIISNAFLTCFPEKSYSKRKGQAGVVSWFNDSLSLMRDNIQFFIELNKQLDAPNYLQEYIKNIKNEYRNAIKAAKKATNDQLISNSHNPIKTMWNIINEYRGITKTETNSNITPDQFNHYFLNIASELHSRTPAPHNDPLNYAPPYAEHMFEFQPVSFNE
uniref:Uncharacterized protein LOC114347463 n=1 Tax=Diabrotica virgifera virgifera TaxID=50390 RepID=A0A6P7GWV8_DIAVI